MWPLEKLEFEQQILERGEPQRSEAQNMMQYSFQAFVNFYSINVQDEISRNLEKAKLGV